MAINIQQVGEQAKSALAAVAERLVVDAEVKTVLSEKKQWYAGELVRLDSGRWLKEDGALVYLHADNCPSKRRVLLLHPLQGWVEVW